MTREEAVALIIDLASRWGENAEEGFAYRVTPDHTDDECRSNAVESQVNDEDVIEIRDLWRAVKTLQAST